MADNTTCPKLNPPSSNPIIITHKTISHLVLDTNERVPGTEVTVTCHDDYRLVPSTPDKLTCLRSGQWNRPVPKCEKIPQANRTTVGTDKLLTHEEKIIVGVTSGVGGVILIVLAILIFCEIRSQKRKNKLKKSSISSITRDFSNTRSTEVDLDSWHTYERTRNPPLPEYKYVPPTGRNVDGYQRPRMGLNPITVPTPRTTQNPYALHEKQPMVLYDRPIMKAEVEPPRDYDEYLHDAYTMPHKSHPSRYDRAYIYDNQAYNSETYDSPRDLGYRPASAARFNDRLYAPHVTDAGHNNSRTGRWSSLEVLDPSPRFQRNRINRTFDGNNPYIWRPMASSSEHNLYQARR